MIKKNYRSDIDGLRAVAVLGVVLFHCFPNWLPGGFIGVDIFFVISGYLISRIIFQELLHDSFSFTEFYTRRILRIFPALITVLFACFVFGWFALLGDELNQLAKHITGSATFVSNIILWSENGYFDNTAETKPLLHLWSLGVEEQFYLLWPCLLYLCYKKRLNIILFGSILILASFFLNIYQINRDPIATFYSPFTRFWELMVGSVLACLVANNPNSAHSSSTFKKHWIDNTLSITALLLLMFGFIFIDKNMLFPGGFALIPVMSSALLIYTGNKATINQNLLSNRFMVWIGTISYPLYLWHWPILSFGRIIYNEVPPQTFRWIALFISMLLAWLTFKYIETPVRFGITNKKVRLIVLCGLLYVLGIIGYLVSIEDLSESHSYTSIAIQRKGEHIIGSSLRWFRGKQDWLFLGNEASKTIDKLTLKYTPSHSDIQSTKEIFLDLTTEAALHHTKVVLFIAADKSTVYPEYLPNQIKPSSRKYTNFFLDELKTIPNLIIYDSSNDLINKKKTEGFLYWMTDSHWNCKGAYIAFSGFANTINIEAPQLTFKQGTEFAGDLLTLSGLKDFPLHKEDNWDIVWQSTSLSKGQSFSKGINIPNKDIQSDHSHLSNSYIWVTGDSFLAGLTPYFNKTFNKIDYLGHWSEEIERLPKKLKIAKKKPDMIVIVRVERSF